MSCLPVDPFVSFSPEELFLVTGASSGIGEAVALRCNALGATVIGIGRDRERLSSLKEKACHPERLHIEVRDLAEDMEQIPNWITQLKERYGKFSGFVHSAGTGLTAPLRLYDLEEARALFDIHFHAPMLIAKAFSDRRNNVGKGAAMVFLSSASALCPVSAKSVYASAKGAILTAACSLARELGPQGIRVNALAPALVETPMVQAYADMLGPERFLAEQERYPFGLGSPEDIATAACFLLSPQARWITGQVIRMDGGRY